MKTHDHMKPFQCAICNRGYNTAAALTSHMQNHKRNNSGNNNGQTTATATLANNGLLAVGGRNNSAGSTIHTANNSIKGREPLLSIQRDNKNNKEQSSLPVVSEDEDTLDVGEREICTTEDDNINNTETKVSFNCTHLLFFLQLARKE